MEQPIIQFEQKNPESITAPNERVDVLKWAIENRCEWNFFPCTFSFETIPGHVPVLKWAIENMHPKSSL